MLYISGMRNSRPYSAFPEAREECAPTSRAPVDPKRLRLSMVRELALRGVADERVLAAMASTPRHLFVPEALAAHAYEDSALPIGYGQTISQPYMVAIISESLVAAPGMRVLEIGAGSGYQAAILSAMGLVVHAVERIPGLYAETAEKLRWLGFKSVRLHLGDGTLGLPHAAPFDRIVVSAGAPDIPAPLVAQLADGGVMVIPVGPRQRSQRLVRISKKGGRIQSEDLGGAIFVDLVGNHGWGPVRSLAPYDLY